MFYLQLSRLKNVSKAFFLFCSRFEGIGAQVYITFPVSH